MHKLGSAGNLPDGYFAPSLWIWFFCRSSCCERINSWAATLTASEWNTLELPGLVGDSFGLSVSFEQVDGSGANVVLTWLKCSLRRKTKGLAEVLGMRIFPETSETIHGLGHITDLSVNETLWGSTENVLSEFSISWGKSTSIKSPGHNVADWGGARTMCAQRSVCLRVWKAEDPYVCTYLLPIHTPRREGRIDMSFISINDMPARTFVSRCSTTRHSK